MLFAEPVIDAQRPGLEVGEDAAHPRQNDMSGHVADPMRFVGDARRSGIAGPSIGLDGGAGSDAGLEEGAQAGGRGVLDHRQTDTAWPLRTLPTITESRFVGVRLYDSACRDSGIRRTGVRG